MRKLRRKWQIQQAEKLAIRAKAEAIKDANKAVSIEAHRRKVAEMKELRMQIHEEKRRLQMAELVGFCFYVAVAIADWCTRQGTIIAWVWYGLVECQDCYIVSGLH